LEEKRSVLFGVAFEGEEGSKEPAQLLNIIGAFLGWC
jgi:hypothetical protein